MEEARQVLQKALRGKVLIDTQPALPEGVKPRKGHKVTVIGAGQVGIACVQTILSQKLCSEIALVDVVADKIKGEALDFLHASAFLPRVAITASTDYAITEHSDVVVITAGVRQKPGETRISLLQRNVDIFKTMIPQIVKYSPDAILIVVSNPCDVLTYVAWKLSGFPKSRVLGSGTNLDTSRFRYVIGDIVHVNAMSVHGWILGEHGDASVPIWSTVAIAGAKVTDYVKDVHVLDAIHKQVVHAAYEIINLKGYTNWAIGFSVASLVEKILGDQYRIAPVTTCVKGTLGIETETFFSLPVVLCRRGIVDIVNLSLNETETAQLRDCAAKLQALQDELKF